MTTKHAIVDFLLQERNALMPRLFFLPFRNALMMGATMDEESFAFMRKLRWGTVALALVFLSIALEPVFDDALSARDALLGSILALFFVFGVFLFSTCLLGYRYRDTVPTDHVKGFDKEAVKSGGLWGVLGLSLWAAFTVYFAN